MKKSLTLLILAIISTFHLSAETYVVTAAKANVRAKASSKATIIGTLQKGFKIDVIDCTNGFAHFDFMGTPGYTSLSLLKKDSTTSTTATSTTSHEQEVAEPQTSVNNTEATLYIFFDEKFYLESMPISFNGKYVFGMEGKESTSKLQGTRYEPSMRKVTIHGEGKLLISIDWTWAQKPYHDEIQLDIADGGTYFVDLDKEGLYNAFVKKRGGFYFKQLKPKEGLKMLKDKKFTINPDFEYNLQ